MTDTPRTTPLWGNFLDRLRSDEESLPSWLGSHPLMKGVAARDVRHFAALLHRRAYDENEAVFRQGDIGSGFFLVRSGTVRILMDDSRRGNIPLATLGEGSLVGEMAIFDSSPRSASAVACEPAILYGLFEGDLDRLESTRPALAATLLRNLGISLALRLKVTNERLRELESGSQSHTLESL